MPRLLIRVRAQIDPVHLADESGSEKDLDQNGEQAVAQGVGRDDHHSAQANPCATEQKTNGEAFALKASRVGSHRHDACAAFLKSGRISEGPDFGFAKSGESLGAMAHTGLGEPVRTVLHYEDEHVSRRFIAHASASVGHRLVPNRTPSEKRMSPTGRHRSLRSDPTECVRSHKVQYDHPIASRHRSSRRLLGSPSSNRVSSLTINCGERRLRLSRFISEHRESRCLKLRTAASIEAGSRGTNWTRNFFILNLPLIGGSGLAAGQKAQANLTRRQSVVPPSARDALRPRAG